MNNIQKQTKAMGKLNTSQMNVRSLSLSETGAMIYCSSIDISESGNGNESTIPIMAQPTSPDSLVFNERLVYSPFLQIRGHPFKTSGNFQDFDPYPKVIYTKCSKHWLYTVAHTIECVCSNHDLIHDFHFTFQAYALPQYIYGICVSLFKVRTWILRQF